VVIGSGELLIREPGGKLLARVKRTASRLYLLTVRLSAAMCTVTREDPVAWSWHERLGHLNFPTLKKMVKEELVRGLPDIGPVERPCAACLAGKQRRTPFPAQAQYRAEKVLELVHGDLCGKITPPTLAGNQYFLLMVDDKSRFMSVVLLSSKNQATDAIKSFQLKAKPETGEKLGGLRTDRGGEFNSTSFLDYCLEQGVQRQLTTPYSPQQNGVMERRNAIVVGAARSMLKARGMPNWFWGEAVLTAVYVLNKTPTKSVDGATP
jgi:transposase InsO family protein